MIGDTIRALREQRAWTQAHLAAASGVSLRTIQRLETVHSCSPETLLALAAAFDVDVRTLTNERSVIAQASRIPHPLVAPAALFLSFPALLFVIVNLLKFAAGWPEPFDAFAAAGAKWNTLSQILISPVLILGGPVVAAALTAATLLHFRVERRRHFVAVTAVEVDVTWRILATAFVAIGVIAVLLGYGFVENFARAR